MRLKESIIIDGLIQDRRVSLSRTDLDESQLEQRSLALGVLIEARNKLDEISHAQQRKRDVVQTRNRNGGDIEGGDIVIAINSPNEPPNAHIIARDIRDELR